MLKKQYLMITDTQLNIHYCHGKIYNNISNGIYTIQPMWKTKKVVHFKFFKYHDVSNNSLHLRLHLVGVWANIYKLTWTMQL